MATLARAVGSRRIGDPEILEALMTCRLLPLNKNPRVRPIGIGEVLRRIIGKSVMDCVKNDLIELSGNLQLFSGQKTGCEIDVHAVADLFDNNECDQLLHIDATNAFNSINRPVMLHNVNIFCPEFSIYVYNCYVKLANLFITGGKELLSEKGTTQKGMYAVGSLPLLMLKSAGEGDSIKQIRIC